MFISVITLHEIEIGVLLAERRDPSQGAVLRRWLEGQVIPAFDERILPVDAAVARRSALLHVPDPRPVRDALIAATALVHGCRSSLGTSWTSRPWAPASWTPGRNQAPNER
jgi:hypothetical protein